MARREGSGDRTVAGGRFLGCFRDNDEGAALPTVRTAFCSLAAESMIPDLNPGEVLVEVRASGINPSDVKNVAGVFNASLPRVPGRDYAGAVVAGDGPQGQEVWGSGSGFGIVRYGAHADYVVVPAGWLSTKPANLSMEEAAALGVPYPFPPHSDRHGGMLRPSPPCRTDRSRRCVARRVNRAPMQREHSGSRRRDLRVADRTERRVDIERKRRCFYKATGEPRPVRGGATEDAVGLRGTRTPRHRR